MSNVIQFSKNGERIALYTSNRIYIGTTAEPESIVDRPGIWLTDAAVIPIRGQVAPDEILRLGSVLVMWDQVVAVSYAPDFGPEASPQSP